jgi:hypothetical protein
MREVPFRAGDAAVGVALALLGAGGAYLSFRLGLGSAAEPGAGLFPFAISILLAGGGIACAARALAHRRAADGEEKPVAFDAEAIKAALLIAGLCILFVTAGFFVAGFAFMWLMLAWVGGRSKAEATIASAVVVVAFWLFFDKFLGIELPWGLLQP